MLSSNEISLLCHDADHLPESSAYLGIADMRLHKTKKELGKYHKREKRYMFIRQIEDELSEALKNFSIDKKEYTPSQKQSFLRKKHNVDIGLKYLRIQHLKMLIKELEII